MAINIFANIIVVEVLKEKEKNKSGYTSIAQLLVGTEDYNKKSRTYEVSGTIKMNVIGSENEIDEFMNKIAKDSIIEISHAKLDCFQPNGSKFSSISIKASVSALNVLKSTGRSSHTKQEAIGSVSEPSKPVPSTKVESLNSVALAQPNEEVEYDSSDVAKSEAGNNDWDSTMKNKNCPKCDLALNQLMYNQHIIRTKCLSY